MMNNTVKLYRKLLFELDTSSSRIEKCVHSVHSHNNEMCFHSLMWFIYKLFCCSRCEVKEHEVYPVYHKLLMFLGCSCMTIET